MALMGRLPYLNYLTSVFIGQQPLQCNSKIGGLFNVRSLSGYTSERHIVLPIDIIHSSRFFSFGVSTEANKKFLLTKNYEEVNLNLYKLLILII